MHGVLSQAASSQVQVPVEAPRHASCRLRRAWSGGQDDARRVMPTASGAIFGWYEWIPHPSATRKWPQVDHRRMTDDRVAHGSASSTRGVRRFFSSKGPHSMQYGLMDAYMHVCTQYVCLHLSHDTLWMFVSDLYSFTTSKGIFSGTAKDNMCAF